VTLNSIIRLPEKIPCDKRIHFIAGSIIASILLAVIASIAVSFFAVAFAAIAVEVFQKLTKTGEFSCLDCLAVIVGGGFVFLPFFIRSLQ